MAANATNGTEANSANDAYISLLKQALTASIYDESAWKIVQPATLSQNRKPWHAAWYAQRWERLSAALQGLSLQAARRKTAAKGPIKIRKVPMDHQRRAEGRDWPLFGYTMVGLKRLDNIQACVDDVIAKGIPGDLIETGVWRGGSTIFMRALLRAHAVTDRVVWVADSFEGLPVLKDGDDGADLSEVDYLAVSVDQVKSNFARFGLLDDQVKFLKGWFSDTLPDAPIEKLAILRLDGDLYSSTMDAMTALYPKVSDGGYVIVDDYGSWPACKRAIDDYVQQHNVIADIKPIDFTGVYWQVRKT